MTKEKQAKAKKPLYKKWWFWVLIAFSPIILIFNLALLGAIFGSGETVETSESPETPVVVDNGGEQKPVESKVTYEQINASVLENDYNSNQAKAKQNHVGKYYEVNGVVAYIDQDGAYITVGENEYTMTGGLRCTFKTKELQDKIIDMYDGQSITIRGKVTGMGLFDYDFQVEEIL